MAPVLKVRPSVQGDVLQDFLPVFRYSMSPQIAMPMKSFWKGQENPKLGYVLILCRMCFFFFFQMESVQCNLPASELAKDRSG